LLFCTGEEEGEGGRVDVVLTVVGPVVAGPVVGGGDMTERRGEEGGSTKMKGAREHW
jgi:hypothetical protein